MNQAAITNTSVNSTALNQKKNIFWTGVLKASTQIIISNITNSIVTWINSGFQGNPAFISNPESFFTDVGDQIAGNFIAGTELGFVCEPFSLDIRSALAINYSSTYVQRNYCRLTDAIRNTENFAKFTNGDFSQGGGILGFQSTKILKTIQLVHILRQKQSFRSELRVVSQSNFWKQIGVRGSFHGESVRSMKWVQFRMVRIGIV